VDSLVGAYDEELAATAFGADVVVHDDAETAARPAAQSIIRRHKPRPMLNTVLAARPALCLATANSWAAWRMRWNPTSLLGSDSNTRHEREHV
jgi:hypothetical protein